MKYVQRLSDTCKSKGWSLSPVWLFVTPWTVARQAPLSMGSLGKNTRVGSHSLLQGLFPTQGSNPDLLHCRQVLYQVSHQGSPVWHVSVFRRPHASVGGLPRRHCRVVGIQAGLPPCCPFRVFLAPRYPLPHLDCLPSHLRSLHPAPVPGALFTWPSQLWEVRGSFPEGISTRGGRGRFWLLLLSVWFCQSPLQKLS